MRSFTSNMHLTQHGHKTNIEKVCCGNPYGKIHKGVLHLAWEIGYQLWSVHLACRLFFRYSLQCIHSSLISFSLVFVSLFIYAFLLFYKSSIRTQPGSSIFLSSTGQLGHNLGLIFYKPFCFYNSWSNRQMTQNYHLTGCLSISIHSVTSKNRHYRPKIQR